MTAWTSNGRCPDRVTSVRVELRGAHAHLTVFWAGKLAGPLVVGEDQAVALESVLLGDVLPQAACDCSPADLWECSVPGCPARKGET